MIVRIDERAERKSLNKGACNESNEYLKMAGIKHFSFFPDLDGISFDIVHDLENEIETLDEFLKKSQT